VIQTHSARRTAFCRISFAHPIRSLALLGILAILGANAQLALFSGQKSNRNLDRKAGLIGIERLVAREPLLATSGQMCQWMPAGFATSASSELSAMRQTAASPQTTMSVDSADLKQAVAKRPPIRTLEDPHFTFAGIAIDPVRNEVVLADENISSLLVYDRLTNTPPTAAMSEPKRLIGGEKTYLEYACSVYVDPATGDIYGVNNDTMNWMPVFGRDARGDVAPRRKLETPHTTFGIVADEEEQELFLTVQDDHAVVVYRKNAKDEEGPVRILQGGRTRLADPHGIALDTKTDVLFVSNWGTSNERPPLSEGGGGARNRQDFPVDRTRTFPGSGNIQLPSITSYPKGAKADALPLRVIQGPKTQLDWPTALAVHPERGELFVANDTGDSVIVFAVDAKGDAAPIRVIKGPRTMVKNPTGVAVDVANNELWVANFGSHSATVFAIDANGNTAPKRVIRTAPEDAPSPMLSNPHTVAFDSKRDEILVAN
jgi:DNA-binding beta-propeller fold protein YncE